MIDNDNLFNGSSVCGFKVVSLKADIKFLETYSANIKQYSLSEQAFTYFNNIKSQIENTGTIFETSNFQIQGNIRSVENPNLPVLGYFGVSEVASKRIFVENSELGIVIPPVDCSLDIEGNLPIICSDCTTFSSLSSSVKPIYWPD